MKSTCICVYIVELCISYSKKLYDFLIVRSLREYSYYHGPFQGDNLKANPYTASVYYISSVRVHSVCVIVSCAHSFKLFSNVSFQPFIMVYLKHMGTSCCFTWSLSFPKQAAFFSFLVFTNTILDFLPIHQPGFYWTPLQLFHKWSWEILLFQPLICDRGTLELMGSTGLCKKYLYWSGLPFIIFFFSVFFAPVWTHQDCTILGTDHRAYDKGLCTVHGEKLILYAMIKLKRIAFERDGNNMTLYNKYLTLISFVFVVKVKYLFRPTQITF